ncbi:MAG: type II toxin-antitoxin system HigB family toxin [Akkermansiaceae bacterium]|nr:type II toxin-antitoxin system HigB family toxin [Akkermansiaceae bacterium]
MRIIKESFLKTVIPSNSKAGKWLEAWRCITKSAEWKSISDVRKTYPSADSVKVESGRTVTIFNVCGNDYRLVTAIHYNCQCVYTLRLLTHAEYDKDHWKKNL